MGLAFRTTGLRNHPPLLLLHGFLGNAGDWQALVHELSQTFYLILVDLPGHGQSQSINLHDSCTPVETMNELINGVLEQLDFQSVSVLGYSMGGRIAMGYALSWPEKVSRLMIESAHPGLKDDKAKQMRWESDKQWAERFASQPLVDVLKDWYQQPPFADLAKIARQSLINERQDQPGNALSDILISFSLANQPDYSQALADKPFPVHFLCGEQDSKYIAIGEQLKQADRLTSFNQITGAGHNIHRAQPEKMAAVIQAFYDSNGVNHE